MRPIVAIGGIHVAGEMVGSLERTLQAISWDVGLPPDQQFKWSLGKKEALLKNKSSKAMLGLPSFCL
jgi:hypothetical protein